MQIVIIAIGDKPPKWVELGVKQFIERLSLEHSIKFISIPAVKRSKNISVSKIQKQEQEQLLKRTQKDSYRIALDEKGMSWPSEEFATKFESWIQKYSRLTFYIGGPDGFTNQFKESVDLVWSLSPLTLPHMLVRVMLAEQLYRASTIIKGHPYHRQ